MHRADRGAGLAVRGRRDEVELGVPGDQAQQLTTRVATGSRYRDPDSHAYLRMTMQKNVSTPTRRSNHERAHPAC
ncbi:hypothetical protein Axi01nite_43040 [Actinoplanes xinjiangensis]|nr:hypothetical protein Axi01nite_43040 [Actinoplanes xinjiangensis]